MKHKKTYQCWLDMRNRCRNQKHKKYADYGGRGIVICQSWLESFSNFFADMGEKPDGMTIERIDNDGPYSPNNCKWATYGEQRRNTRANKIVNYKGAALVVSDCAKAAGIPYSTLRYRLSSGVSGDALFVARKRGSNARAAGGRFA